MSGPPSAPAPSLLRHPDFVRLWTAETVSQLGTQVSALAIPFVAIDILQATTFEVALLNVVDFLPFLLIGLPAGVWVDRLRRRPVMIAGDLGRALALATIPLAFLLGVLTVVQLYVVGFAVGVLTVFFDVAYQSYLPSVVDRDQLVEGNSKLEITRSAAQILGPGAAGILIGWLKAPFAMVLDAFSYLVSAAFLFLIRRPEPPVEKHDEERHGPKPSMRQEMAAGLRYVTGHRWLRSIAATTGTSNFFGNVGGAILILYLVQERGLGAEAIGFAFSVGSLGVLAGALTTSRITARVGVGRMLIATAFGFSISGLPVAFAPDALIWWAVAISGLLGGYCSVGWNINQVSLRQAITPPRMQGRMNATMRFIVWGTMPIGAILGGALGSLIGLQATIVIGALGGLIAFIPVTLSSVRHIVRMPEPVEDEGEGALSASA